MYTEQDTPKEIKYKITLAGGKKCKKQMKKIRKKAKKANKKVRQLNESLKEFAELRDELL